MTVGRNIMKRNRGQTMNEAILWLIITGICSTISFIITNKLFGGLKI